MNCPWTQTVQTQRISETFSGIQSGGFATIIDMKLMQRVVAMQVYHLYCGTSTCVVSCSDHVIKYCVVRTSGVLYLSVTSAAFRDASKFAARNVWWHSWIVTTACNVPLRAQ